MILVIYLLYKVISADCVALYAYTGLACGSQLVRRWALGLPPLDRRKAMPGGTVNLKELEAILASSDVGGIQEWLEGLTQSELKRVASCLPPTSRSPVAKSSALRASSLEHDPPPREGSL